MLLDLLIREDSSPIALLLNTLHPAVFKDGKATSHGQGDGHRHCPRQPRLSMYQENPPAWNRFAHETCKDVFLKNVFRVFFPLCPLLYQLHPPSNVQQPRECPIPSPPVWMNEPVKMAPPLALSHQSSGGHGPAILKQGDPASLHIFFGPLG